VSHVSQTLVAGPEAGPAPAEPTAFGEVKGWFAAYDQVLFDWFLTRQNSDAEQRGDLLELGAFLGKSAIFLGRYLREGEEFTVCDLFDSPAPDDENLAEMRGSYPTLTRRGFETNYLAFHPGLPTVIQAPTSVVADRVRPASCRFVHVDASHLYEHVAQDIAASRVLTAPDAVVVFDDYRAAHCPGVAAAVWAAVARGELRPICVSASKLYATWGDPAPYQAALLTWLEGRSDLWHGVDVIAGRPMVRIGDEGVIPPPPPRPLRAPAVAAATGAVRRPGGWRRLVKDLLPPVVTRAVIRLRRAAYRRTLG
jgi:hypothetical protein